jgi:hypothetical protein
VLSAIREQKIISDATEAKLKDVLAQFKENFLANMKDAEL